MHPRAGSRLALIVAVSLLANLGGHHPGQTARAAAEPGQQPPAAAVICVDPGHPSETNSGRTVQNGTTELAMDWEVASKVAVLLEREQRLKVVKTRDDREKLTTNRARAELANRAGARLFLRLHCDTGAGSGFTLYYPDRQATKDGKTGPPLNVIEASRRAAAAVHRGMAAVLGGILKDNGVKGESATAVGKKQGALTGSIYAEVPAVTVEMVFLSNPADAQFIRRPVGQAKIAAALARGVAEYLGDIRDQ